MRTRELVVIVIGAKVALFALIFSMSSLAPGYEHPWFSQGAPGTQVSQPVQLPAQRFLTWDGYHYVFLAENGYTPGEISNAFYPLWPFLVKITSSAVKLPAVWTAVILTNIISLVAFGLLHAWLKENSTSSHADITMLLFLTFPGSLFYLFPYSESLFLFLVAVFFLCLEKKNEKTAAVAAFCLPLTRGVGVFIALPILYYLFRQYRAKAKMNAPSLLLLVSVPLGLGAYFFWMTIALGDPMAGWQAQAGFAFPEEYRRSLFAFLDVELFIVKFLDVGSFHNYFDSFLDRLLFVGFVASLPFMWRLNRLLFWFSIGLGLFPVMTGSYMSYMRYISVVFPAFYVLAAAVGKTSLAPVRATLMLTFAALQIVFIIRHSAHFWVG